MLKSSFFYIKENTTVIFEILSSAGFGTLLGGVFGWLGKREERENLKLQMSHELSMLTAKTEAAKVTAQLQVEKSEADAFVTSQETKSTIADTLKAIVRPMILGVLLHQTYTIMISLDALTGGLESFSATEVLDMYRVVILSIIGLTSTAVGWYFAQRTSKQFDKLLGRL